MSDTLQRYGMQHTRLPCRSPTPRVYSNSCPLSRWCHPAISSSVILFSSCLSSHQVAKISEFQFQHQSFQWIFRTDFLWWTSWISLESKDSRVSPTSQLKSINSLALSFLAGPTLTSICDHWKTIALTRWTFVDKVLSLWNPLTLLVEMQTWICCSMSSSNCCLLTSIQVSQEAGQVVWYPISEFSTVYTDPQSQRLWHIQ